MRRRSSRLAQIPRVRYTETSLRPSKPSGKGSKHDPSDVMVKLRDFSVGAASLELPVHFRATFQHLMSQKEVLGFATSVCHPTVKAAMQLYVQHGLLSWDYICDHNFLVDATATGYPVQAVLETLGWGARSKMTLHMPLYLKWARVCFFRNLREECARDHGVKASKHLLEGIPTVEELVNGYDMSFNCHEHEYGKGKCPCASCMGSTLRTIAREEGWEELRRLKTKKFPKKKKLPAFEAMHPQYRVLLHDEAMQLMGFLQAREDIMQQCQKDAYRSFRLHHDAMLDETTVAGVQLAAQDSLVTCRSPMYAQYKRIQQVRSHVASPAAHMVLDQMLSSLGMPSPEAARPISAIEAMALPKRSARQPDEHGSSEAAKSGTAATGGASMQSSASASAGAGSHAMEDDGDSDDDVGTVGGGENSGNSSSAGIVSSSSGTRVDAERLERVRSMMAELYYGPNKPPVDNRIASLAQFVRTTACHGGKQALPPLGSVQKLTTAPTQLGRDGAPVMGLLKVLPTAEERAPLPPDASMGAMFRRQVEDGHLERIKAQAKQDAERLSPLVLESHVRAGHVQAELERMQVIAAVEESVERVNRLRLRVLSKETDVPEAARTRRMRSLQTRMDSMLRMRLLPMVKQEQAMRKADFQRQMTEELHLMAEVLDNRDDTTIELQKLIEAAVKQAVLTEKKQSQTQPSMHGDSRIHAGASSASSVQLLDLEFDAPAASLYNVEEELPYAMPTNGVVPMEWFRYCGPILPDVPASQHSPLESSDLLAQPRNWTMVRSFTEVLPKLREVRPALARIAIAKHAMQLEIDAFDGVSHSTKRQVHVRDLTSNSLGVGMKLTLGLRKDGTVVDRVYHPKKSALYGAFAAHSAGTRRREVVIRSSVHGQLRDTMQAEIDGALDSEDLDDSCTQYDAHTELQSVSGPRQAAADQAGGDSKVEFHLCDEQERLLGIILKNTGYSREQVFKGAVSMLQDMKLAQDGDPEKLWKAFQTRIGTTRLEALQFAVRTLAVASSKDLRAALETARVKLKSRAQQHERALERIQAECKLDEPASVGEGRSRSVASSIGGTLPMEDDDDAPASGAGSSTHPRSSASMHAKSLDRAREELSDACEQIDPFNPRTPRWTVLEKIRAATIRLNQLVLRDDNADTKGSDSHDTMDSQEQQGAQSTIDSLEKAADAVATSSSSLKRARGDQDGSNTRVSNPHLEPEYQASVARGALLALTNYAACLGSGQRLEQLGRSFANGVCQLQTLLRNSQSSEAGDLELVETAVRVLSGAASRSDCSFEGRLEPPTRASRGSAAINVQAESAARPASRPYIEPDESQLFRFQALEPNWTKVLKAMERVKDIIKQKAAAAGDGTARFEIALQGVGQASEERNEATFLQAVVVSRSADEQSMQLRTRLVTRPQSLATASRSSRSKAELQQASSEARAAFESPVAGATSASSSSSTSSSHAESEGIRKARPDAAPVAHPALQSSQSDAVTAGSKTQPSMQDTGTSDVSDDDEPSMDRSTSYSEWVSMLFKGGGAAVELLRTTQDDPAEASMVMTQASGMFVTSTDDRQQWRRGAVESRSQRSNDQMECVRDEISAAIANARAEDLAPHADHDLKGAQGGSVLEVVRAPANPVEFELGSSSRQDPDYKSNYLFRWRSYVDRTRRRTAVLHQKSRLDALDLRQELVSQLVWVESTFLQDLAHQYELQRPPCSIGHERYASTETRLSTAVRAPVNTEPKIEWPWRRLSIYPDFTRDCKAEGAVHPFHYPARAPFAQFHGPYRLRLLRNGIDYRRFGGSCNPADLVQPLLAKTGSDTMGKMWAREILRDEDFASKGHHVELFNFVAALTGRNAYDCGMWTHKQNFADSLDSAEHAIGPAQVSQLPGGRRPQEQSPSAAQASVAMLDEHQSSNHEVNHQQQAEGSTAVSLAVPSSDTKHRPLARVLEAIERPSGTISDSSSSIDSVQDTERTMQHFLDRLRVSQVEHWLTFNPDVLATDAAAPLDSGSKQAVALAHRMPEKIDRQIRLLFDPTNAAMLNSLERINADHPLLQLRRLCDCHPEIQQTGGLPASMWQAVRSTALLTELDNGRIITAEPKQSTAQLLSTLLRPSSSANWWKKKVCSAIRGCLAKHQLGFYAPDEVTQSMQNSRVQRLVFVHVRFASRQQIEWFVRSSSALVPDGVEEWQDGELMPWRQQLQSIGALSAAQLLLHRRKHATSHANGGSIDRIQDVVARLLAVDILCTALSQYQKLRRAVYRNDEASLSIELNGVHWLDVLLKEQRSESSDLKPSTRYDQPLGALFHAARQQPSAGGSEYSMLNEPSDPCNPCDAQPNSEKSGSRSQDRARLDWATACRSALSQLWVSDHDSRSTTHHVVSLDSHPTLLHGINVQTKGYLGVGFERSTDRTASAVARFRSLSVEPCNREGDDPSDWPIPSLDFHTAIQDRDEGLFKYFKRRRRIVRQLRHGSVSPGKAIDRWMRSTSEREGPDASSTPSLPMGASAISEREHTACKLVKLAESVAMSKQLGRFHDGTTRGRGKQWRRDASSESSEVSSASDSGWTSQSDSSAASESRINRAGMRSGFSDEEVSSSGEDGASIASSRSNSSSSSSDAGDDSSDSGYRSFEARIQAKDDAAHGAHSMDDVVVSEPGSCESDGDCDASDGIEVNDIPDYMPQSLVPARKPQRRGRVTAPTSISMRARADADAGMLDSITWQPRTSLTPQQLARDACTTPIIDAAIDDMQPRIATATKTWIVPHSDQGNDHSTTSTLAPALRSCHAPECNTTFPHIHQLRAHVRSRHAAMHRQAMAGPAKDPRRSAKPWTALCADCLKPTHAGTKAHAKQHSASHQRKHTGGYYACGLQLPDGSTCPVRASQPGNLRQHMQQHARDRPVWCCPGCEYVDVQRGVVRRHVRAMHLGVMHRCSECGHETTRKTYLKAHMAQCHPGVKT